MRDAGRESKRTGSAAARDAQRITDAGPRSGSLYYLYCVVEPGTDAHHLLSSGQVDGMQEDEALFPVEAGGLVAAVSRVPSSRFESEPLNNALKDISTAAPLAAQHDGALRRLQDAAPAVVPVTLGTVFQSINRVERLLKSESDQIKSLLRNLHGCQEWGVKVFEHSDKITDSALLESDELRNLDSQIRSSGPGRAFLLGKQRQQVAERETERLRNERLDDVIAQLMKRSSALKLDKLVQPPVQTARLVLKVACLVERRRSRDFLSTVEAMKETLEPYGLELQVTGPWAPYSFADITKGEGNDDQLPG